MPRSRFGIMVGLASMGLVVASLAGTGRASAKSAPVPDASTALVNHATAQETSRCPWLDQSLSVSTRVHMLMSKMTLDDDVSMMTGTGSTSPYVYNVAAIPSLCIPAMGLEDGPNGVGDGLTGVTQLPDSVALAAAWSPSLAKSYGQVIGSEQRAKGATVDLGPTVNIDRDPRWGRSFEALSEDPDLNASLATSEIDGVQSQGTMAQVKHIAVYNQETNRNTPSDDAIVSQRALHEIYLPSFWAASNAGVASAMCAYSTINGEPACGDTALTGTTLDQRWGFPGFITSDYGALHSTVGAADAGIDQEMPSPTFYGAQLEDAVQSGQVDMSTVTSAVSRILTEMFRFNDFDDPPTGNVDDVVTTPAHQAIGTQVAEAGTVLLKNAGNILPLDSADAGTVAVIGPAASASPTDTGGGSDYVTAASSVTPLQGIQAAAGAGTTVTYTQGLPTDTSLAAVPTSETDGLEPAYTAGGYSGTLTVNQTGTYVFSFKNTGNYTNASLSLNGTVLLNNPGTPPVSTYSVAADLTAGQSYALSLTGPASSLSWAQPSDLAPQIQAAASAAASASTAVVVVSDDTESEAADRASLNLPSAQNELIEAVAAANPHTVVVIDAGAPVAMPWLDQVSGVVDGWYPGQSNGTALAAVLFGSVNPSGHLPVTFPQSLSQVAAAQPNEFPGTNGQVDYSEGIDVGYRYYEAKDETPMFPFGYGLSYTSFKYSDLAVTPITVDNTASGPSATNCACNGQSTKEVTVSATVTNTGQVAGSDVAQLYLGDPAVAGEPARQLKGFDKVTLKPGQSTTVTYHLTGHDLSYFDTAANGWVEPDGTYHVYVGDSSAVANLPLQATLSVKRTVGVRDAVLSAPAVVSAGTTSTVRVRVDNEGDYEINTPKVTLSAPKGWTVKAVRRTPASVPAGKILRLGFTVTVPKAAVGTSPSLTATVTFAKGVDGATAGRLTASTSLPVAYSSLTAAVNNTGISNDSEENAGDYDGQGDSFSAQALAGATPTSLAPGKKVTVGGTTLTWPRAAAGDPDNVVAAGQTIRISGTGTDLGFILSSQNGTTSGTGTIHYTDDTSQSFSLTASDWWANTATVGNTLLTTTSSWNYQTNPDGAHPVSLYFAASVPLAAGKTVAAVTLPQATGYGTEGDEGMHIWAMATGKGTATVGATLPNLAAAYDNVGISDNTDVTAGNYDGTGDSFSSEALADATPDALTPGGTVTVGGVSLTWPDVAAGTADNVVAGGQIVALSGTGSELGFLDSSQFGTATGYGTIHYTDGTSQRFTLNAADWYANTPAPGGVLVAKTSGWNTATGPAATPVSIYLDTVAVNPDKTVSSVTLPDVSTGVGSNVTAMHIWAMALGSGKPTG